MLPGGAAAGPRTPLDCTGVVAALCAFYPAIIPLVPTTTPCSFDMKRRLGSPPPAHCSLVTLMAALLTSLLHLSAAAAAGASGLQSFTGVRHSPACPAMPLQVSPPAASLKPLTSVCLHAAAGTLRVMAGDAAGPDGGRTELSWAVLEAPPLHLRIANGDMLCTPRCPDGWGSGARVAVDATM